MSNNLQNLSFTGISGDEMKIYETTLELKEPTVLGIAKKSNIPRTTAYRLLENLEKKGLVSSVVVGKRKQYIPESPSRLLEILKQRERAVEQELPKLKELYTIYRNRPSVRLFKCEAGMRAFWEEALQDRPKAIWGFGNIDDLFARYPDFVEQFSKRRARRKIPVYIITPDSALARERQRIGPKELRFIKILAQNTHPHFHSYLISWKDKIALFSFANEDIVVLLESQEIALIMQILLKLFWKKC